MRSRSALSVVDSAVTAGSLDVFIEDGLWFGRLPPPSLPAPFGLGTY